MQALEKISKLPPAEGKDYIVPLIAKIPGERSIKTAAVMPFYKLSM